MKKNSMSSKYISFALIVIVVLGGSSYLVYNLINPKEVINKVEIKNEIINYGYTLDDRDTVLMKNEFELLKQNLTGEKINEEEYIRSIAKLFVIDLYTMNNKVNSYDVPCLEYIEPNSKENFQTNVINTLYKHIVDNTDGKRNQDLPEVNEVKIVEVKESSYKLNENDLISYEITIKISYQEDLGYPNTAYLKLVKINNKFYVVSYNNK